MDRDEVEVHKNAKRERGQYPAIFTELAWSIKDLLYGIRALKKKNKKNMIFAQKRCKTSEGFHALFVYCI